ncbi:hypothetical protein MTR67_030597 [Solanum verrucosum]|uniref:Tf2-1-like SH3-like domain-containing protein n=1 Tax=Solanum verrucosum TaxID=315347 RepID=A0AAF0R6A0_SOLVR|nr:hypothetical protein MTR67_030597 [Solanum verrucosum]
MAPFEALYGRRCRSPVGWFEVGEFSLIGPELVYDAIEKVRLIRERLKTAQSWQKSYADVRRRDLEFQVGDSVYLKISPMKGVMRFGKKGKLSPRYVGQYQTLKRVGKVAYELDLPNELAPVHPVLHVSMLKKCIGDPISILPLEGLGFDENLSYEEVPMEILDRQVKRLSNKKVVSVKVLWRNYFVEGATWEAEADINSRCPHFFPLLLSQLKCTWGRLVGYPVGLGSGKKDELCHGSPVGLAIRPTDHLHRLVSCPFREPTRNLGDPRAL